MLLLIDIFSINRSRGYENPSLEIIVIEIYSTRGCPLEEAREHCAQNQSAIYVVILISFQCYCADYYGYIVVILPFLAFYLCFAYFLYLVYFTSPLGDGGHTGANTYGWHHVGHLCLTRSIERESNEHPCVNRG
jgi:hypothetical protein